MKKTLILLVLCSLSLHSQWKNSRIQGAPPVNTLVAAKSSSGVLKIYAGTHMGMYCSSDSGTTWVASSSGLTSVCVFSLMAFDSVLFAGTWGHGFYKSVDEAQHWISANSPTTQNLTVRCLKSMGKVIFAGTNPDGIFRSTSGGSDWMQVNTGLTNKTVTALAMNNSKIIAGTSGGIFVSADSGAHWIPASSGTTKSIQALTSDGIFDFASTVTEIYRSTDQGDHWTLAGSGISSYPITAFVALVDNNGSRYLYASSFKGRIFQSTDDGINWSQVADLQDTLMTLDTYKLQVFAGSQSGTVWQTNVTQIGTDVHYASSELPIQFRLFQNYPNPFNPVTNVEFRMKNEGKVKLAVYDLLGREVAVLVNERKPAGRYEVTWDASRFSSGAYFCTLQAGAFRETRRMILMK